MKTLFKTITLAIIFLFYIVNTAISQETKGAVLEFTKENANLGTLYTDELELTKMDVEFENKGNEPLVVSSVRGCCGTRIVDYTKQPILPGQKGKVSIEFRLAPQPHMVSRRVSIMSNDARGIRDFMITGEVAEKKGFGSEVQNPAGPRSN